MERLDRYREKLFAITCEPIRSPVKSCARGRCFNRGKNHGKENETKNRPPEIADAAAAQPAARRKVFRSPRKFRPAQRTIFSRPLTWIQSDVGPAAQTAAERIFHFRDHPGGGTRHPHQSAFGSAVRSALVSSVRAFSRIVALGGAG